MSRPFQLIIIRSEEPRHTGSWAVLIPTDEMTFLDVCDIKGAVLEHQTELYTLNVAIQWSIGALRKHLFPVKVNWIFSNVSLKQGGDEGVSDDYSYAAPLQSDDVITLERHSPSHLLWLHTQALIFKLHL